MQPEYRKKRDRLKKVIEGLNIDALLVTSLVNVQYLCGFTGSNGFLLISDIHEILFTDSRYIEQGSEETFNEIDVCKKLNIKICYTNIRTNSSKHILNRFIKQYLK